jgi:hypothetical protein
MLARRGAALMSVTLACLAFVVGGSAHAALVPTVPLGTAANYSVLAGSAVTNVGDSVLNLSLGLWDGTSITGFPPGKVNPPATTDKTNGAAQQAQADLTVAYVNAHDRPIDATTTADLTNLVLQPGVYAGPEKGALELTGPLILDGAGDLRSVFIFQTNSMLTTAASSTVTLINGAQECNVFWQVGSSATLGATSVFVGNILALTSITVGNGVMFRGRALARNGAVSLHNDTFTVPTCAQPEATTTTLEPTETTIEPATTTTLAGETTTTVPETTTTLADSTTTTLADSTTTTLGESTTTTLGDSTTTTLGDSTTTTLAATTTTLAATTTTVPVTTTTEQPAPTTAAETTTTTRAVGVSTTGPAVTTTLVNSVGTSQSSSTTTIVAVTTTSQAQTAATAPFAAAATTSSVASGGVAAPAMGSGLTELPETGSPLAASVVFAALALIFGTIAVGLGKRRPSSS